MESRITMTHFFMKQVVCFICIAGVTAHIETKLLRYKFFSRARSLGEGLFDAASSNCEDLVQNSLIHESFPCVPVGIEKWVKIYFADDTV